MSTTSMQYRFSVTSVKTILVTPSRIRQREISLTPNIYIYIYNYRSDWKVRKAGMSMCTGISEEGTANKEIPSDKVPKNTYLRLI